MFFVYHEGIRIFSALRTDAGLHLVWVLFFEVLGGGRLVIKLQTYKEEPSG